jgi:hypothetical protein
MIGVSAHPKVEIDEFRVNGLGILPGEGDVFDFESGSVSP